MNDPSVLTSALARARWEVMWTIDGKIIRKRPGSEFPGSNFVDALELYNKARRVGKPGLTLRCTNVGFPPPERYLPKLVRVKLKNSEGKFVKRNGRFQYKEVIRSPIKKLNREGIWWCPYCMQFRKFKPIRSRYRKTIVHRCPMCKVSHDNHHVKQYNPIAHRLSI